MSQNGTPRHEVGQTTTQTKQNHPIRAKCPWKFVHRENTEHYLSDTQGSLKTFSNIQLIFC